MRTKYMLCVEIAIKSLTIFPLHLNSLFQQMGKTLFEVVDEGKDKDDKKTLRLYNEIEV